MKTFWTSLRVFIGVLLLSPIAVTTVYAQMQSTAEFNLKHKNIVLPSPLEPIGNYVPAVRTGNLLFISGHGPRQFNPQGKVGKDLTIEQGYQAARTTGLNLLATIRAQLGSLDKVTRIVKVLGMVNSAPGFTDQPKVINGFSDLMIDVFGDRIGAHARSAVGVAELPLNIPVEIEIILEVE